MQDDCQCGADDEERHAQPPSSGRPLRRREVRQLQRARPAPYAPAAPYVEDGCAAYADNGRDAVARAGLYAAGAARRQGHGRY